MGTVNTDKKKNDDSPSDQDENHNVPLTLRIKCTSPGVNPPSNPTGDYQVETNSSEIVSNLKERIRDQIGQNSRGRYIRLIAKGRLLAPDTAPISKFNVKDGDCVHVVLAAAGVRGGMQAAMSRGLSVNDGRSLGNNGSGINYTGLVVPVPQNENDDDDLEAGIERIGFDRLREYGLSRDEIGAIRLYFSQQVDQYIEQQENRSGSPANPSNTTHDRQGENDDLESRRERQRMEEAWMSSQGPNSEFWLNLNTSNPLLMADRRLVFEENFFTSVGNGNNVGTERDFAWGFTLGFFIGFVMMFFVWMPTVPHKQKLGILCGLSLKIALGMLEQSEEERL